MNYSRIHKLCTQLYLDLNRLKNRFVCKKELKSLLTTSLRRHRSSPHLFSLVLSRASKKEIQILQLLAHGQCTFLFSIRFPIRYHYWILKHALKSQKIHFQNRGIINYFFKIYVKSSFSNHKKVNQSHEIFVSWERK